MTKREKIKNCLKLTKIKIVFLFLIFFFISIPFIYLSSIKFYNRVSLNSSALFYQKKEKLDFSEVCKKIQNFQIRELCFLTIENKDFNEEEMASILTEKEPKIDLRRTCGLFEFGSAPYCISKQEIEKIIIESKNNAQICQPAYLNLLKTSGIINNVPPQVYCQAIVENPYFCGKIPLDILEFDNLNLQRRECYLDTAVIWKDDSLCEKLRKKEKDFCYLMLVVESYK